MASMDEVLHCNGCGAEIYLTPIIHDDQIYCCQDCVAGFQCDCGKTFLDDDLRQSNTSPY